MNDFSEIPRHASSWSPRRLARHLWKTSPARTAEHLSDGRWQSARHLEYLNAILTAAAFEGGQRIMVEMPPRSGKSELVSHWFPAWYLARYPEHFVMTASYNADLATDFGRKVKATCERHPELGVRLDPDSKSAQRWNTRQGGGMFAGGVGGSQTGRGANLLLIDDPIKNLAEAYSQTVRQSNWDWYLSTAYTRLEKTSSVVLVMTRWHEDDLAGRLLREQGNGGDQWTVIRFPAIAEGDDVLGRVQGEALWPWKFPIEYLRKIERVVGPLVWSALYQQRPTPSTATLFPKSAWKFAPFTPRRGFFDRLVGSVDCSFDDAKDASFVVMQVWGFKGARAYLLHQTRERMDFTRTAFELLRLAKAWPEVRPWYVERKANGPAIMSALRGKVPAMIGVEPYGSKIARAAAVQPFVIGGNVILPNPDHHPWVRAFIDEAYEFPRGANDDQVDAFSQALSEVWVKDPSALLSGEVETDMAAVLKEQRWTLR